MTVTDTVGVPYKRGVTGSELIDVYLADTPDALSRDSHRLPGMDLKDATLMILNESAAHPSVAKIAQAAYDQLASGQEVDHRVLDELVGEASGNGVLRAIRQKYGATAHEAIFAPILREIDREKPCTCREPRPCHATRRYSLIMPSTRVSLRRRYWSRSTGSGSGFSGAAASRERWGRC